MLRSAFFWRVFSWLPSNLPLNAKAQGIHLEYYPRTLMPKPRRALEETLISVWRQTLVEGAKAISLGGKSYPVRRTARRGLCQVDFEFEGESLRGLEQNPETKSRWAQMARAGSKVMQFLSAGRYLGNIADGKVTLYHRSGSD